MWNVMNMQCLPRLSWIQDVQLKHQFRQRSNAHRWHCVFDFHELMQNRRIHDRFRVFIKVGGNILALSVSDRKYHSSIRVLGSIVGKVMKGFEYGCVRSSRIHLVPAPKLALFKSCQVKACDDSKIFPPPRKAQ